MRYTVKHTLETDADSFWTHVFFDEEYNRALHRDVLGCKAYEMTIEQAEPSGILRRRLCVTPKDELPAAARAIFGIDSFAFTEVGQYDPSTAKFRATTQLNDSDRITLEQEIYARPLSDGSCERVAVLEDTVKLPGLSAMIEAMLQKQARENLARAASFTNRWLREKTR